MQVNGTIIHEFPVEVITDKFRKKQFVVKTIDQYPQEILMEVHNEKIDEFEKYKNVNQVNFGFNIRGRKWTSPLGEDKWFNTIVCYWFAHVTDGGIPTSQTQNNAPQATQQPQINSQPFHPNSTAFNVENEEEDNLPF